MATARYAGVLAAHSKWRVPLRVSRSASRIVPPPPRAEETDDGDSAVLQYRRICVLTGAGCSTESGIPDYRGRGSRPRNPIQIREFKRDAAARQRYWARSVVGWSRFTSARPNAAHLAIAELEHAGVTSGLITQNVDGLHGAAGSQRMVELHGALARVICMSCGAIEARAHVQQRLLEANPGWDERQGSLAPDGDAELDVSAVATFRVVDCAQCGGTLKPHVVLFGENVPRAIVDAAWRMLDDADVLLVVGSSLAAFSGYRFVREAVRREMPVAIVNQGPTRGDAVATVRVEGRAGEVLPRVADALAQRQSK